MLEPSHSDGSAPAVPASAVLLIAAYIACQMLADVASLKIGLLFGLAVDMGSFIYPVTFSLRDAAHRLLGRRNTRVLILAAGLINVLMALYLWISALAPADPAWGLQAEFASIFTPVWRIVLASIAAELVSELVDTEVYHWFVTTVTRRHKWLRVLVSNSASVPVDNVIFALGAFGWALPWPTVFEIFLFNLLLKYGVTVLSLPLIYLGRGADRD